MVNTNPNEAKEAKTTGKDKDSKGKPNKELVKDVGKVGGEFDAASNALAKLEKLQKEMEKAAKGGDDKQAESAVADYNKQVAALVKAVSALEKASDAMAKNLK